MKRVVLPFVVLLAMLAMPFEAYAGSRGSHTSHSSKTTKTKTKTEKKPKQKSSAPKTVHVKAHTKKDGTHVDAYDRSAPHSKGSAKPPNDTEEKP